MRSLERYNSLSSFLKNKFGEKVYKVSLNGGFTCPNRDGSKGSGGCIYCNPESNQPLSKCSESIKEQLFRDIDYIKKRHRGTKKFISYFQHFSNTYKPAPELKKLYHEAISHPDVVGVAISSRPDCLNDETLKLLEQLNNETFLWLEFGLQSANDRTLDLLNRGHTSADFASAVKRAHGCGIMTCAHIILGLPNETHDDMMKTIALLAELKVWGVKLHNLHILKDTPLAKMYEEGKVPALSLEEYARLVVDCLERLPKETIIHRFNSHSPRRLTIAPAWSVNKLATMNAVHNELERRDAYQGKFCKFS